MYRFKLVETTHVTIAETQQVVGLQLGALSAINNIKGGPIQQGNRCDVRRAKRKKVISGLRQTSIDATRKQDPSRQIPLQESCVDMHLIHSRISTDPRIQLTSGSNPSVGSSFRTVCVIADLTDAGPFS